MGMTPTIDLSHLAVTRGLVGYWMGGVQGVPALGTVRDLSSKGKDGTLVGNAYVDGDGVQFDGDGDYVETPPIFSSETTYLSASIWVKKTSLGYNWDSFIRQGPYAGSINGFGIFRYSSSNAVAFAVRNGANYQAYSSETPLSSSNWIHLVMVYDGSKTSNSNRLKGYIDGLLISLTYTGTVPATGNLSEGMMINRNDPSYDFNGSIDDVRIYNRGLSAAEVRAIYDNTLWRHQNA